MIDSLIFFEKVLRSFVYRFYGIMVTLYLRMHGCSVGRNLRCRGIPHFRSIPKDNIRIGHNFVMGRNITIAVEGKGQIVIGDDVKLSQDILISSLESLTIGNNCIIAESVTVRDADHIILDPNVPKMLQGFITAPVTIGENVWIGAGVRILRGAKIPDGAVIAANAVVLASTKMLPHHIHAGLPAVVKKPNDSTAG